MDNGLSTLEDSIEAVASGMIALRTEGAEVVASKSPLAKARSELLYAIHERSRSECGL